MYFFHLYLEALEVHKCDYFQCQISHVPSSSISEQMEEEHFSLFFPCSLLRVQHRINKQAELRLGK